MNECALESVDVNISDEDSHAKGANSRDSQRHGSEKQVTRSPRRPRRFFNIAPDPDPDSVSGAPIAIAIAPDPTPRPPRRFFTIAPDQTRPTPRRFFDIPRADLVSFSATLADANMSASEQDGSHPLPDSPAHISPDKDQENVQLEPDVDKSAARASPDRLLARRKHHLPSHADQVVSCRASKRRATSPSPPPRCTVGTPLATSFSDYGDYDDECHALFALL